MSELSLSSLRGETAEALPATSLSAGAELFVWSVREWLAAARERRCVKRNMIPRYHAVECVDAIVLLDEMMCLLAVSALRMCEKRPIADRPTPLAASLRSALGVLGSNTSRSVRLALRPFPCSRPALASIL